MCQPWLGSCMTTLRHALRLVPQGLSATRVDLAAFHHSLLGHEAARWNCKLQGGGSECTASHGGTSPAMRQCCGFSLLVPQAGWCRLSQGRQEARCGVWGPSRSVHQDYCAQAGNSGRSDTPVESWRGHLDTLPWQKIPALGTPRVVCKKESVQALAVLACAVVALTGPGVTGWQPGWNCHTLGTSQQPVDASALPWRRISTLKSSGVLWYTRNGKYQR